MGEVSPEGVLVPKILVADDNSNIQKMVALALKDQGIDVVAVGNGEAAVRKIADVRPDLVLADVFMPVRNGYEVCQFVKMESALSHIPVILLVGAFDPLDEQEAQRVGADGVLKKPFIPPDPLISMVKSALQRSGAGHVTAPVPRATEPEAAYGVKDVFMPGAASVPAVNPAPVPEFHMESGPETENESFVEELPPKPQPLQIDSSSQPVAFGSLLETPAEESAEDSSFATSSSPEFTREHDWRDRDDQEVAEEEDDEEPPAWRPEGTDEEELPAANAKKSRSKSSADDWRAGGFEQIAASKSRNTGWAPEEGTPEPAEVAPVASSRTPEAPRVPAAPVKEPMPAASRPPAAELWAPPVPPPAAAPSPTVSREKRSPETTTAVVEDKTKPASEPKPVGDRKNGKESWFSASSSPWEGEIQKANQLASTWDAPTVANPAAAPKNGTEKAKLVSQLADAVIEQAALPRETVEAIREEAVQVAEDATFVVETEASESQGSGFYAQEEEAIVVPNGLPPTSAPPAASNMDDLVRKVLAKMSPEVLQAVTREILKPVVEAMVKEELKPKKP
jgi:CheY-like chemotaxis protein